MSGEESQALFWDSCIFYRFLTEQPADFVPDIKQFIADAQRPESKVDILCSTIAFAEIKPSILKVAGYASVDEFFDDMQGVFKPISPSPDIMKKTATLKDWHYKHATKKPRHIGTPDAIHLLTCLHAIEDLGYSNMTFHTFDNGSGKTWEGKCVPLLSFQDWTAGADHIPLIGKIAAINRSTPNHPEPSLILSN